MNNKQTQHTSTELESTELKLSQLNSTELSSAGVFFPSGVMSLILEYCDDRGSAVKIQAVWRGHQARNGAYEVCVEIWDSAHEKELGDDFEYEAKRFNSLEEAKACYAKKVAEYQDNKRFKVVSLSHQLDEDDWDILEELWGED
jgi:hypothetical protein